MKKREPIGYAYLAPALISMAVLSFFPIAMTVYYAFTNFNLNHMEDYKFVGFKNFVDIITGPFKEVFAPTFAWTFTFALVTVLINFAVGLLLAVLLNNKFMKETNIYRSILIIPWAIPGTIASLAWQGLLNEEYGAINMLLKTFHIDPIPWMTDPFWAKISIFIVNLWLSYPFMMNASLGALQSIPPELYEVAEIDGAGWFTKLFKITIPMIVPTALPILISSFAYAFNNFNVVYLVTGGGPARLDTQFAGHTDLLVSTTYKLTMQFYRYDLASAMSIIIFFIVGTISLINMKLTRAFEGGER
ncbi:carbohydrate ABC transporter permease [Caldicellulosiruptor acetigenus]|jgi:arabinogalactan oligomer/maltooligosaccharide transport system permease protein|uniref:Maltose/maltodextrin transport system permease protein n=1 Tax=Caldicellulosiruptor acetigenus 6A TaxID=632516 RepID=G2PWW2_9FIRM|nr:sugar ABC transporter permease [Caldicellulosiruptor acetigenus]AEM74767.1 ABC-type transporter, integral membrane subunit [Caldicellulosiruptor acetigenus 6A]WAM36501.1 sugar ABC transporter permease [Caldicellulosiruptor acetigenus]